MPGVSLDPWQTIVGVQWGTDAESEFFEASQYLSCPITFGVGATTVGLTTTEVEFGHLNFNDTTMLWELAATYEEAVANPNASGGVIPKQVQVTGYNDAGERLITVGNVANLYNLPDADQRAVSITL